MEAQEGKKAYVYMLTNNRGNVLYIGSTEDLKTRLRRPSLNAPAVAAPQFVEAPADLSQGATPNRFHEFRKYVFSTVGSRF